MTEGSNFDYLFKVCLRWLWPVHASAEPASLVV